LVELRGFEPLTFSLGGRWLDVSEILGESRSTTP